jgi:hypothetical protein
MRTPRRFSFASAAARECDVLGFAILDVLIFRSSLSMKTLEAFR